MKTISLALMSPDGDELGLLAVPGVQIAEESETDRYHTGVPERSQMDEIHIRVREALEEAGLETPLEPLDLRILVGRALVRQIDREVIVVPVPVLAEDAASEQEGGYPSALCASEPDRTEMVFARDEEEVRPGWADGDASDWAGVFTMLDGPDAEGGEP